MNSQIELLKLGGFYDRGGSTFHEGNLVSAKIVVEDSKLGEYSIPISEDTLAVAINVNSAHNKLCRRFTK